jgi:hypothetical protein
VLEKLAARVPTVACDASGARETLGLLDFELPVSAGDAGEMARRVVRLMEDAAKYTQLAALAADIARRFCWTDIPDRALDLYTKALAELRVEA